MSVGLGEGAPNRPCASLLLVTPGIAKSALTIGSFQMDAAASSRGSAGCSTIPMPNLNHHAGNEERESEQLVAHGDLRQFFQR